MRQSIVSLLLLLSSCAVAPSLRAQPRVPETPSTPTVAPSGATSSGGPTDAKPDVRPVEFPNVVVDRAARQVRVACEVLAVEAPLEFFCVARGGPEHESVLRTAAKPSHIHAGLLMLGATPGSPVTYDDAKNGWTPPFGPPLRVTCEWKDAAGKTVREPAEKLMRSTKDKSVAPPQGWIFAGSHQRADGAYLADMTGYIVTLCNFEHALIDVPRLVSSSNETLEYAYNAEVGPKRGEPVTMILEPIDGPTTMPRSATQPSAEDALDPEQQREAAEIAALRDQWRARVKPHEQALRDAARTHYEVLAELRKRQQKLIDEADRLQALIDDLDKEYQEMTTPRP